MTGLADLRPARAEDAAAITALVESAYAHYPARIGGRPRPVDAGYGEAIERNEVWVAAGAHPALLYFRKAAEPPSA